MCWKMVQNDFNAIMLKRENKVFKNDYEILSKSSAFGIEIQNITYQAS